MGLKSVEGLREFCAELSSDSPSPGGGCASAASGGIGASLLVMVCGIALKKKDARSQELTEAMGRLEGLRDRLLTLADEDARSFDAVMEAIRRRRAKDDEESRKSAQDAIVHAADVPMDSAYACLEVLESSIQVAQLGLKSTSTDLAVGVMLADAGLRGAVMNVRINLRDILDKGYVDASNKALERIVRRGDDALSSVLLKVEERYGTKA